MTPTPIWPTPTPFPTTAATAVLQLSGLGTVTAEGIVQGYQQANNLHLLDLAMFFLVLILILGGLWSIVRHLQRLNRD